MIVRDAEVKDIERLVELGELFFNQTILSNFNIEYDPESIRTLVETFIKNDNTAVIVLEADDKVVGAMMGMIVPLYFNNDVLAAQQFSWFVIPEYRSISSLKLLYAFESWAVGKGVKIIFSGAKRNNEFEGMDKMMKRKGYFELESVYIKGDNQPCQQL